MGEFVGQKKGSARKRSSRPLFSSRRGVGRQGGRAAAGSSGRQCPTKKSLLRLDIDVYVRTGPRDYHKARLRIKKRKTVNGWISKFLYLAYRDGKKVTEKYIAKLESGYRE